MNEKRFTVNELVKFNYSEIGEYVDENHTDRPLRNDEVVDLLNEQQATIRKLQDLCGESDGENAKLRIENEQLRQQLKQKQEEERLYANEILELREANKEFMQFKELGGDY